MNIFRNVLIFNSISMLNILTSNYNISEITRDEILYPLLTTSFTRTELIAS